MLRSGALSEWAGAAELAFGSDTAALFLLILSSPLVLTPQIVRTQFRVAFGIALSGLNVQLNLCVVLEFTFIEFLCG